MRAFYFNELSHLVSSQTWGLDSEYRQSDQHTTKINTMHLTRIVIQICLLFSTSTNAEPYGPARENIRIAAQESSLEMEALFHKLSQLMQTHPITGDVEHDQSSLAIFKRSQQSWQVYTEDYCSSSSYLEVYPADSRMFASTFHNCINSENQKRIHYLRGLVTQLTLLN